jgi:hypothetical protein
VLVNKQVLHRVRTRDDHGARAVDHEIVDTHRRLLSEALAPTRRCRLLGTQNTSSPSGTLAGRCTEM